MQINAEPTQYNMSDMDDFVYSNYLVNYSKEKNLEELFYAYQSPARRNTYINDPGMAALYMIARGRPIMGVMEKIISQHPDIFQILSLLLILAEGRGRSFLPLVNLKQ